MSAVSNNVTPALMARSTISLHDCSSGLPHRPNIIVPRASVLTSIPLAPNFRYCIASGHARLTLEHQAVPIIDPVGDATIANNEAHDTTDSNRPVVGCRSQRVGRKDAVAVGYDIFDLVAQSR